MKCLVLLFLILSLVVCQSTENEPTDPLPDTSGLKTQVSLSFDIFNHTQGFIKKITRETQAGETLRIAIKDLEVEGIDDRRIVIREGQLGPRVAYSRTGECEFSAPEQDKAYTVYLMNASHGAEYRAVDVWVGIYEGNLQFPRQMMWCIENRNGFEGPSDPITDVVHQMNEALDFPWSNYGKFIQVSKRDDAHFSIGYGFCEDQYGWHTLNWAGVNPDHCPTEKFVRETFLEEIFELVTSTENIAEKDSVSMIADLTTGQLNKVGRDLFAYIFVKDVK